MSNPHESGSALGPDGVCVCIHCGFEIKHEPGYPCMQRRCPECDGILMRRGSQHHLTAAKYKARRETQDA